STPSSRRFAPRRPRRRSATSAPRRRAREPKGLDLSGSAANHSAAMNLQQRVTNILTKPAAEWQVVAAEPADVASLYRDYIAILAAIPAVCGFIGWTMVGVTFIGRIGMGLALRGMIGSYIQALIACYIAAVVVEKVAPSFGSSGNTAQALKLVAYAYTPIWLAGVLALIPILSPLTLLAAIYAIYLCYLGLPPVMKPPSDKVIPYMIVSAIVIIVVSIVLGFIFAAIGLAGAVASGRIY